MSGACGKLAYHYITEVHWLHRGWSKNCYPHFPFFTFNLFQTIFNEFWYQKYQISLRIVCKKISDKMACIELVQHHPSGFNFREFTVLVELAQLNTLENEVNSQYLRTCNIWSELIFKNEKYL